MTGRTHKTDTKDFLPVSREDMRARGWDWYDILLVTGDAYVDHPSFGAAVIGRLLENAGYRVAVLAQPAWNDASTRLRRWGGPSSAFSSARAISTAWSRTIRRRKSAAARISIPPAGRPGCGPTAPCTVYCQPRRGRRSRGIPVLLGGMEASLRRFAHYDYWDDKVRRSVIFDARADILVYGMGESATLEAADASAATASPCADIRGTAVIADKAPEGAVHPCRRLRKCGTIQKKYALATRAEYAEHDPIRAKTLAQAHGDKFLVVYPPAMPLQNGGAGRGRGAAVRARRPTRCTIPSAAFRPSRRCALASPHNRGLLRRVQLLRADVPSGAHHPDPLARVRSSARPRA